MQPPMPGAGARLVPLGVVAGTLFGAATGARSLVDDVPGLWFSGLLFGAVAGAVLGGVVAALSAAVVTPRALAAPVSAPVSLGWQLLVPVPAAAGPAWWVLQSPSVHVLDRVVLTAAVAAACAALVVATSRWVLAPVTAARGGTPVAPASR